MSWILELHRKATMSWETYISSQLLGTGNVSKAAIHGLDGNPWASSAGFTVRLRSWACTRVVPSCYTWIMSSLIVHWACTVLSICIILSPHPIRLLVCAARYFWDWLVYDFVTKLVVGHPS